MEEREYTDKEIEELDGYLNDDQSKDPLVRSVIIRRNKSSGERSVNFDRVALPFDSLLDRFD